MSDEDMYKSLIGLTNHARNSKHPEFWPIMFALFGGGGAVLTIGMKYGATADELIVLIGGIGLCTVVFTTVKDGVRLIITAFKNKDQ